MEHLDSESHQVREVYARFGLAMYQAQCVERQLAILLATEYGPGITQITRSRYDELLESLFRKTLGNLIAHLRKAAILPADFDNSLGEALRYRNWLVHNYFWERAGHFMTEKGRLLMIAELDTVADFLSNFDGQLHRLVREWLKTSGMDEKTLEADVESIASDLVREAKSGI